MTLSTVYLAHHQPQPAFNKYVVTSLADRRHK